MLISSRSPTDLGGLLNRIGKEVFIRYFDQFRDSVISNEEMIDLLPQEYALKSRRSRTAKARRIFREHLEEEALSVIAASEKVSAEVSEKARRLLAEFGR